MEEVRKKTLVEYFENLEDPRVERGKRHSLPDIITIAICAVICGTDSWVYVEMFGKSKEEWFRTFLDLPNGVPSHDTFGEVFSRLDPGRFQECFMEWSQGVAELLPGDVVAINGKTARRSHDSRAGKGALHLVSAWASANTLDLGTGKYGREVQRNHRHTQVATTAGPERLRTLLVARTIDAMGCQKDIAQGTLEQGADYVLAVKQNQRRLYEDLKDLFEEGEATGF